jgi:siroheme synthase-like protein
MKTNNLYPIFIKLDQVETLIVGGGNVGLEKVEFILRQAPNAKLRVVSPSFHRELILKAIENPNLKISERTFREDDLQRVKVLILATNDAEVNASIRQLANKRGILINEVDQPSNCEFYTSAVVKKGSVKIAVSSNGVSPTLAKRLRDIIEAALPEDIEQSAEFLNNVRSKLKGDLTDKIEVLNRISEVISAQHELDSSVLNGVSKYVNYN